MPCKAVSTVLTGVRLCCCENVDQLNDCVTDYLNLCVDIQTREKEVLCYTNNKPWMTKDLKKMVNEKKPLFAKGIELPSN